MKLSHKLVLKAVIFDVDGVLIDSFDANLEFFQNVFRKAGYKIPSKNEYQNIFHLTMGDVLKFFIKGIDKEEFKRILSVAQKTSYPINKFKLPENSREIIKKLSKKYKLALVTGRTKRGVNDYLDFSKTKNYFKVIVHFSHYKNPKPHPESLLIAVRRLKIEPSEAIYVGDALTDMQAARAAGMKFILFSKRKLKGTDYKADSFKKLLSLIEKL